MGLKNSMNSFWYLLGKEILFVAHTRYIYMVKENEVSIDEGTKKYF